MQFEKELVSQFQFYHFYCDRRDLRKWISQVDLPCHSPHKFRHGFAVYAIKLAKNIGELKAISQNLMHSYIKTTDSIYGGFSEKDVKEQIISLIRNLSSDDNSSSDDREHLLKLLEENQKIIRQLQKQLNQ